MINTYKYNGETWVDLDHPSTEEVHEIMDKYKIHPLVAKELTSSTRKPRIEFHDNYIYCILHFPAWKHSHSKESNQEVDFIIGNNILITARYDNIDALHKFSKTLEVKEILEKDRNDSGSHTIFINMLHSLYGGLIDELEYIDDLTKDITKEIFTGKEKEMVISISEITRTLLDFRRVTDLHREVLESLHHQGEAVFGKSFARNIEIITLDYLKTNTTIRANLEILHELRDTNNSMLTTKQNEIMKNLTVMGFVVLPLNLIAWIFAMRVDGMPLTNNPNGFWIIMTIMVTVVLITLTYAKNKKWLQ